MTHGKTYKKSPRRINPKATKSKTNTRTTVPERPAEQTTGGGGGGGGGGLKVPPQPANPTPGPDATLKTETHKKSARTKAPNSAKAPKRKHKNQTNHHNKQRRVPWPILLQFKPPVSATKGQGNDQTNLQCQAARHCHHQVQWATCAAWHWGSGPYSEEEKTPMVWICGTLQWCSQDSLWHTDWWKAWAWEAQDDMEAADREGL